MSKECTNCGETTENYHDWGNGPYCTACFIRCDCGNYMIVGTQHEFDSRNLCPSCFDRLTVVCCDCSTILWLVDSMRDNNARRYCMECYEGLYTFCESCEEETYQDDIDGNGYCPGCSESTDRGYYNPRWRYYDVGENMSRAREGRLYYGLELEVENEDNVSEGPIERAFPDFVATKGDGSIYNGFEIVSHPATYEWIVENRSKWEDILSIRDQGFRSFNTTTCGIHIHMSKDAFGEKHLYRFLKFFYGQPDFVRFISQRSQGKLDEWANMNLDYDNGRKNDLKYKSKHKAGNGNRYSAINFQRDHTIEVRVFRGNLNPRAFFKNLQFLESLVRFTKNFTMPYMTVEYYLKYVKTHKEEFEDLHGWIKDNMNKYTNTPIETTTDVRDEMSLGEAIELHTGCRTVIAR